MVGRLFYKPPKSVFRSFIDLWRVTPNIVRRPLLSIILTWCEAHQVDFVIGVAKNPVLVGKISSELEEAKRCAEQSGESTRIYTDLRYKTAKTWSCERRVVAKAECLAAHEQHQGKKFNPRFVVTTLSIVSVDAATLYESVYCARGHAENRTKELELRRECRVTCQILWRCADIFCYSGRVA